MFIRLHCLCRILILDVNHLSFFLETRITNPDGLIFFFKKATTEMKIF